MTVRKTRNKSAIKKDTEKTAVAKVVVPERRNYFRRLVDDKDPASVKRFLALCCAAHLIVTSFILTFTKIPNANTELLKISIIADLSIIGVAILGMSVETYGKIVSNVSKIKAAADILTPQPTATNIEHVDGDVTGGGKVKGDNKEIGDEIFEESDLKKIKNNLTNSLTKEE